MTPDETSCSPDLAGLPEGSPASVLRAVGLAIGYGQRCVGKDIALSLSAGEILCLLGPNGSGKSTLFKTLLGLLPPQAGRVDILGRDVRRWQRPALARHVGYVPQASVSQFPFTLQDIVLMGRTAHMPAFAVPSAHDRQAARECLALLGIAGLADAPYNEVSGGERQLALIARALAQSPDILVLDEPTASLDFGNQLRVLAHIRRLKAAGLAILLCTHQPEHALHVADRVALFRDGGLHETGDPRTVMTVARMAWLYGLQPEDIVQWQAGLEGAWSGLA